MRLLGLVTGLVLFSAACGGCSDDERAPNGSPWRFNGAPDQGLRDDAAITSADVGTPTSNICATLPPVTRIDEGQLFERPTRPIAISADSFWFVRHEPDGRKGLYRQRSFTADPEYLRDVDALLDAGPAGVLFVAGGEVTLRNAGDGSERRLAPATDFREWSAAPFESAAYRLVDRDVLAWVTDGVYRARGTDVVQLARPSGRLPYVRTGAVAYTADDGELVVETADREWRLGIDAGSNVAMSNDHLWFRPQGEPMYRLRLDGLDDPSAAAQVRPPGTTGCDGLAVSEDGKEVAASCASEDGSPGLFYSPNGETWRRVADLGAALQQTFAVGHGWVIYADFVRERPAIIAVPPDGAPVELGVVQQACLSCGAYWAPNFIEFEDGLVAWNYARREDEDFGQEHVGMARVCIIPR